jgi:hypothetical protein
VTGTVIELRDTTEDKRIQAERERLLSELAVGKPRCSRIARPPRAPTHRANRRPVEGEGRCRGAEEGR